MALTQVIGRGLGTQTTLAGNNTLVLDTDGIMTRPLQPAFLVKPSSSIDNLAINTSHTIAYGTEIFDQNGDFSSNTFTAPVTGRYQLNVNLYIHQIDHDVTYYQPQVNTSNRTYYFIIGTSGYDADVNYMTIGFHVLADMDANDTVTITFPTQNSGAAQVDIGTDSWFSGYLVC